MISGTSNSPMMMGLPTDGQTTQSMARQSATTQSSSNGALSMDDFYQLLASQIANQDMNDPMDTSQFMDQMMQMAVIQSIDTFTDIAVTQYAASLVGKEVTVAEIDELGKVKEVVGTITATGTLNGQQVIFVNDTAYTLSQIMAIGKLPDPEDPKDPEDPDPEVKPDGNNGADISKPVAPPTDPTNPPTDPDGPSGPINPDRPLEPEGPPVRPTPGDNGGTAIPTEPSTPPGPGQRPVPPPVPPVPSIPPIPSAYN